MQCSGRGSPVLATFAQSIGDLPQRALHCSERGGGKGGFEYYSMNMSQVLTVKVNDCNVREAAHSRELLVCKKLYRLLLVIV